MAAAFTNGRLAQPWTSEEQSKIEAKLTGPMSVPMLTPA
jgi:hypothetical protein